MNIKRKEKYFEYFEKHSIANWKELTKLVNVSELTIRRDMKILSKEGLVSIESGGIQIINLRVDTILDLRKKIHGKEKSIAAKIAAKLIKNNDTVFIDSGSTTELIINHITASEILIVTNGLNIAYSALKKNIEVILLGGIIKQTTLASTGFEVDQQLEQLFFTKSFIGSNGASFKNGYSTPDIKEANIKKKVIEKSEKSFVVMDASKFNKSSLVKFAELSQLTLITNKIPTKYKGRIKNDL